MLDAEISKKAVICLQEVSTLWAGALHAYFAKAGYHFVTGLYGKRFNGCATLCDSFSRAAALQ
jgi:exonuclease III